MHLRSLISLFAIAFLAHSAAAAADEATGSVQQKAAAPEVLGQRTSGKMFTQLFHSIQQKRVAALAAVARTWSDDDAVMLVEVARLARSPQTKTAVLQALGQLTGESFGRDFDAWYDWVWRRPYRPHINYANFKQQLYARLDERFAEYFDDSYDTDIRLDEIRWGGVRRDGIPPLKNPDTLLAADAGYLADSDVVFGVEFGGHARAYPKRILAWHEMVKDVVGGQSINGVYCTLCGSMIVYDTELDGTHYELGTSGFLYRSNKLMYDHKTKSMWSTLSGTPVVGPLVGQEIRLKPLHVVTTTWGAWKKRHPQTDVLSLKTGYRRDYGEGVAYRKYFGTDKLMFSVPATDDRLKNKAEVLVIREGETPQLAITAEFLADNTVYHTTIGQRAFVVLTDASGASRVYESGDVAFKEWINAKTVAADDGTQWTMTEDALIEASETSDQPRRLPRAAAHRAFWFAIFATSPKVRLVK